MGGLNGLQHIFFVDIAVMDDGLLERTGGYAHALGGRNADDGNEPCGVRGGKPTEMAGAAKIAHDVFTFAQQTLRDRDNVCIGLGDVLGKTGGVDGSVVVLCTDRHGSFNDQVGVRSRAIFAAIVVGGVDSVPVLEFDEVGLLQ